MGKQIEVQSFSDEIAEAVRTLSRTAQAMKQSGLKRRALLVLLNDLTGVTKTNITYVLDGLESLENYYLEDES